MKEKGYKLVWSDEFDGNALDATKWSLYERMSPTKELKLINDPAVICVKDSELQLTAINYKDEKNPNIKYATCYGISTQDRMNYKYGYLEMRAKVPFMKGAWPSLWGTSSRTFNMRENKDYNTEVDIFEVFGSESTLVPNLHKWYAEPKWSHVQYNIPGGKKNYVFENTENLSNEYHIYGFKWTPDEMSFYVDDEKYTTIDLHNNFDDDGHKTGMEGFHDPITILINNHLFTESSPFKTNIISEEQLPVKYCIDYIRLYQDELGELNIN